MNQPLELQQSQHLQEQQYQPKNTVSNIPTMMGVNLQPTLSTTFREKKQRQPQIKFYEGYSSFNDELLRKNTFDKQYIEPVHESMVVPIPISPHKSQPIDNQKPLTCVDEPKVMQDQSCIIEGQNQRMVHMNTTCKIEETGFKNRVCQSYSMNRIYASINLQSREAMKRKLTRGMYSIASRKYQSILDSREIFDDQDLKNSVIGPDQCRLWRNLMNKYFLRSANAEKTKKKTILKSEIKVISEENEGRQAKGKKQIKPKGKKRIGQEVLIKKQEENPSENISQHLHELKSKSQFNKCQRIELKREEGMEDKGTSNLKSFQVEHMQIQE